MIRRSVAVSGFRLVVAIALGVSIATPSAIAQQASPAPVPEAAAGNGESAAARISKSLAEVGPYRIGPEDVVLVSVWNNEAISRAVPVRPDGMISLPLLGDVQAAGHTPAELREVLAKRLVEYMPMPEVSVIIEEVRSFKVSVIGEVARPGRFELKSWTTVLDVLAEAGGFNQFANRSRIVVLRPDGRNMVRLPFNYNRVVAAGGEGENFYLQPGDIVLVP